MAICDRYAANQDDALEIMNDGFLKVFREVHNYKPAYADVIGSFKGWLRKIMVYTAIDHFRKSQKHHVLTDLDNVVFQIPSVNETALDKISHEEIIRAIQELSPGYRTVLNLYIIEGLTHDEISKQLGISEGTSKSNLAKARKQLQKILFQQQHQTVNKNVV